MHRVVHRKLLNTSETFKIQISAPEICQKKFWISSSSIWFRALTRHGTFFIISLTFEIKRRTDCLKSWCWMPLTPLLISSLSTQTSSTRKTNFTICFPIFTSPNGAWTESEITSFPACLIWKRIVVFSMRVSHYTNKTFRASLSPAFDSFSSSACALITQRSNIVASIHGVWATTNY